MSETKLIVGLGNPGQDYEFTRHNLGFLVVRQLAECWKLKLSLSSFTNGLTAEGKVEGQEVCLLMPLTYMNNSGAAVLQAMNVKQSALEKVLVICDDVNLDYKQIRVRSKGSDGGNNGLKSVIAKLGSQDFSRLRLGVGSPKRKEEMVDYVLEEFTKAEKKELDDFIIAAVNCTEVWLKQGTAKAMDQFNGKPV